MRRGDAHLDAGEVDAFVVGDGSPTDDFGAHGHSVTGHGTELDDAIADQNAVAGLDIAGKSGIAGSGRFAGAEHGFGGNGEDGPGCESAAAILELAEPDLGSLKVEQYPGVNADTAGLRAHGRDAVGVLLLGPMRSVKAKYVHAGKEKLFEYSRRIRSRSECRHNLRVGHRCCYCCRRAPRRSISSAACQPIAGCSVTSRRASPARVPATREWAVRVSGSRASSCA